MSGIQKVPMYNVCIADVVVRIEGTLYNNGRIIVDRDTFNFAGHLTDDDYIIGHYDSGKYYIKYFCYLHLDGADEEPDLCSCDLELDYAIKDVERDLLGKKLRQYGNYLSVSFLRFDLKNKNLIGRILEENADLVEFKL